MGIGARHSRLQKPPKRVSVRVSPCPCQTTPAAPDLFQRPVWLLDLEKAVE